MNGIGLWIAQNVWTFLVGGLVLSLGTGLLGASRLRRALRRRREGAARWTALALPVALLAVACLGLAYFVAGTVIMGPGLLELQELVGEPAPELRFARVSDGTGASLAGHRGSVVLLNVWATWCPPCRHELPALDRLQRDYAERGLVVLQISDEPRPVLVEFLESSPMSTEHGFVDVLRLPDAGRPTSYVVDREGVVRRVILGPRTYEQFEAEIRRYL